MNHGHLFIASVTALQLAAAYFYFVSGDRARGVMFAAIAVANVSSLFIGD